MAGGRFLNERFADAVVDIPHEAAFFALHLPQVVLRRLRARLLQPLTQFQVAVATLADGLAGMGFAVAIHGDVYQAQIHSQNIPTVGRRGRGQIDGHEKKKGAVPIDQIGLSLGTVESRRLVGAIAQRDHEGQIGEQAVIEEEA